METEEVELKHREWKSEELKAIHSKGATAVIRHAIECSIDFFGQNTFHYPNKLADLEKIITEKTESSDAVNVEHVKQLLEQKIPSTYGKHTPEVVKEAAKLIVQVCELIEEMEPPKIEKLDEKFFISFIPILDLSSEKSESLNEDDLIHMGQHACFVLTLCFEVFEDFELVKFRVDFDRQIFESIIDTDMVKPLSEKLHGLMLKHNRVIDEIAKIPLVDFKTFDEIAKYKLSEEFSEKVLQVNRFLYFLDELFMSSLGSLVSSKELSLELITWIKKLNRQSIWHLPFQLFGFVDTISAFQDTKTGDLICNQFWDLYNNVITQYNQFFSLHKIANQKINLEDPGRFTPISLIYVDDITRKVLFGGVLIGEAASSLLQRCSALGYIKAAEHLNLWETSVAMTTILDAVKHEKGLEWFLGFNALLDQLYAIFPPRTKQQRTLQLIQKKLAKYSENLKRVEIIFADRLKALYYIRNKFHHSVSFGMEIKYAVRTLIQGCERNSPYTRTKEFIHGANEIIKLTKHQMYIGSHFNPKTILPRYDFLWRISTYILLFIINILMLIYYRADPGSDSMPYISDSKISPILYILTIAHTATASLSLIGYIMDWFPILIGSSKIGKERSIIQRSLTRGLGMNLVYLVFAAISIWQPLFSVADVFLALCMLPVAEDMILAFYKRIASVLTTFTLGLGFVYVFCVIGFVGFRNRYEFGSGGPIEWGELWRTLLQHLNYGMQSGPVFRDDTYAIESAGLAIGILIFNLIYNFAIVLILVAIISGLIIDQFGAIRDEREQAIQDLKERCFICNIAREEFDKLPTGYHHHIQTEHNISDYVGFLFLLKNTDLADLTSVQKYCLRRAVAGGFSSVIPIKRSLALESQEKTEDISDDAEGRVIQLNHKIDQLTELVKELQKHIKVA